MLTRSFKEREKEIPPPYTRERKRGMYVRRRFILHK
jgi:hypothetical protein